MMANSNYSFYEKVLSDFKRYSYFVSIDIEGKGRFIIENDDLFYFFLKHQNLDKGKYKEFVLSKLIDQSSINITDSLTSSFIKVESVTSVNANAQKGADEFILTYFDNGKVLKDGIKKEERTAIIQKLFEWEIPSRIDDETGYLVISR
jgi:hypothetical protein